MNFAEMAKQRKLDANRFYLMISGDKEFTSDAYISVLKDGSIVTMQHSELVAYLADKLLSSQIEQGREIRIVTGDNIGIDQIATTYSIVNDYERVVVKTDWDKNGSQAGYRKNETLYFKICNKQNKGVLLFWNGVNQFTLHLIYLAYEFGLNIKVYNYETKKWLTKETIEMLQRNEADRQSRYK